MSDQSLTEILRGEGGEARTWGQLLPLVYDELRGLAQARMAAERLGHTLQPTALVHEAFLRLMNAEGELRFDSRRHFFGSAAEAMRRVLIDHARRAKSQKRGGDLMKVTLGAAELVAQHEPERLLALDEALEKLQSQDPRAAEVARLRYYAGLDVEQTARALDVSVRTVKREWAFARARLTELLGEEEGHARD